MAIIDTILNGLLGILLFMFTEKLITQFTSDSQYEDGIRMQFILGIVIGIAMIYIALEVVGDECVYENRGVEFALYASSAIIIINNVALNWSEIDDGTKSVFLSILITCIVSYSYYRKKLVDS